MPNYTVYTLGESQISISGGGVLSGFSQGDGSHLAGLTITLNSNAWQTVSVSDDDANFNDSENGQTLNGATSYDGLTGLAGTERVEAEYTLTLQDPDGNTYTVIGFNINEPGATSYATVEGLAFIGGVGQFPPQGVPLTVIATSEGPGGATTPYSTYATPPCFTPGTRIETPSGLRRVEDIAVGDMVLTLDHGARPVRWIGRTTLSAEDLRAQKRLRPVHIQANAFGAGMPERDMLVSPQHRILRRDYGVELLFGCEEVLVPALHLVNGMSVRQVCRKAGVEYLHLAFDRHELVMSDGLPTESFFPGATVLAGFDADVCAELELLFPGCAQDADAAAARPCVTGAQARLLAPDLAARQ